MIKAPFNFVPLNNEVFFPDWLDQVSHDIPFKDGESGYINLEIEAITPVFVRNGHVKDTIENDFSHYIENGKKQYFIPGSSIKGMIRNVFEANSFCKINPVNDSKFPYRDVSESTYRKKLENTLCGFLKKESSGKYVLSNRGTPGRISMKELSGKMYDHFCAQNVPNNESGSKAKYEFVDTKNIKLPCFFKKDKIHNDSKPKIDKRDFYNICDESDKECLKGKIVFTGQNSQRQERNVKEINLEKINNKYNIIGDDTVREIFIEEKHKITIDSFINGELVDLDNIEKKISVKYYLNNNRNRKEWRFSEKNGRIILNEIKAASGKAFEFIFFDEVVDTYELYISNDCIRDFFTMHKYSPDFKDYWSGRMEKGEEIPVFFTLNSDQQVENIGLSYMFKYPYSKSVYNAIGDIHRCNRPDLGEIVFGSIQHNLKGRVRFSHAKLESRVNENRKTVSLILSNPRASYYPIYLQSGEWNNPGGIKGRKQYLVYNAVIPGENNNSEVQSELIPLPANYKFSSKIYYHNLNKVEFGALLSAITFHGNNDCYYNLGAAKPFGYGRVKVVIKNIMKASLESNKLEPYPKSIWLETLIRFEEEMEKKLAIDWKNSPHINNLYLMSKEIPNNKSDDFKYMRMNMDNSGKNEFLSAKKNKENLPYYADIICNKLEFVNINTLIVSAKIEEDRIALEKEKRQIEFANKRKQQEMALELGGKYFIGDEIEITVISAEKPKLGVVVGASVEVQIVTKMAIVAGNIIKCTIKQKAKDGRIVQVEY